MEGQDSSSLQSSLSPRLFRHENQHLDNDYDVHHRLSTSTRDAVEVDEYGYQTWFRCNQLRSGDESKSLSIDFLYEIEFGFVSESAKAFLFSRDYLARFEYQLLYLVARDLGLYTCASPSGLNNSTAAGLDEIHVIGISSLGVDIPVVGDGNSRDKVRVKGEMTAQYVGGPETAVKTLVLRLVQEHMIAADLTKIRPVSRLNFLNSSSYEIESLAAVRPYSASLGTLISMFCFMCVLVFSVTVFIMIRRTRLKKRMTTLSTHSRSAMPQPYDCGDDDHIAETTEMSYRSSLSDDDREEPSSLSNDFADSENNSQVGPPVTRSPEELRTSGAPDLVSHGNLEPNLLDFVDKENNEKHANVFCDDDDEDDDEDAFAGINFSFPEPSNQDCLEEGKAILNYRLAIPAARVVVLKRIRSKRKKPYRASSASKIMETIEEETQQDLKSVGSAASRTLETDVCFHPSRSSSPGPSPVHLPLRNPNDYETPWWF